MDLTDYRQSYEKYSLADTGLPSNPLTLFRAWFDEAVAAKLPEPYAMSLATCGDDNRPSVRIVLMRELTEQGVVFYTNYDSAKGQDIADNPNAEVLFFWHSLERQVRLSGQMIKVSAEKSAAYFAKRPRESQLGAWVSQPQSGVVDNRQTMEEKFLALDQQHAQNVPYPSFWGGYELIIDHAEFWQGRLGRMHDRMAYTKQGDAWQIMRLLP
ncbi:Pyridoxamine 5'-phosphate oxidase [Moraxella catarrhalis]|uniref:pyridoxamine 5'-phosphate oxidase n=1 Tax=Moraxella catarrhalis TaxID=480 RepID=UPI0007E35C88|nr:pyridoxamine 5'-phosphate oxidase [Moraxella catarrhalis]MPX18941.1 pyridoxamine 5'-phosphate oxidase [Moraxella catarrhalis]OAV19747.1 Pyridoxamine 5'-phosphate oxidase [Moraxella catarrhalis]